MSDRTLRTIAELEARGLVRADDRDALDAVVTRYAVAVPPAIRDLIEDPTDPIARQFLPDTHELTTTPEERADPIGDEAHSPCEGIVHRYPDRVLLKLVQICPVYCRFCFRREMVGPGKSTPLSPAALSRALLYVADHPEIWEVILTGGDPLAASPRRLADVARRLAPIGHVKILRIHTRLPVVAPERVTPALIDALLSGGKTVFVAIHANHARELTSDVHAACRRLTMAGIALVSQTVLLRGVNDDADTLAELMRRFVEFGIKPYYLHHPDLAPGTGHFRLSIEEGQRLVAALRGRVSGLCQPTYVLDIPGGHGKIPIGPTYIDAEPSGGHRVTDPAGQSHTYPPEAAAGD